MIDNLGSCVFCDVFYEREPDVFEELVYPSSCLACEIKFKLEGKVKVKRKARTQAPRRGVGLVRCKEVTSVTEAHHERKD